MRGFWVSCHKFTCYVEVDDKNVITDGAPIIRRFIGQRLLNLFKWMRRLGGFQYKRIN